MEGLQKENKKAQGAEKVCQESKMVDLTYMLYHLTLVWCPSLKFTLIAYANTVVYMCMYVCGM